jgi:hypothetical protein
LGRHEQIVPVRAVRKVASSIFSYLRMPALLTRMSRRPNFCTVSLTKARHAALTAPSCQVRQPGDRRSCPSGRLGRLSRSGITCLSTATGIRQWWLR